MTEFFTESSVNKGRRTERISLVVTRNASDRMSETLNTTIGPLAAKLCNSDSDGPSKNPSKPSNDRIESKRLSNCFTSARRSAMAFDKFTAEDDLYGTEESTTVEDSKVAVSESTLSRSS